MGQCCFEIWEFLFFFSCLSKLQTGVAAGCRKVGRQEFLPWYNSKNPIISSQSLRAPFK